MGTTQQTDATPAADRPEGQRDSFRIVPPSVSLPKGGGAIRGIGEKFSANPVTGTGSLSVPIALSPGRGGFSPQLALSYDSGAGNGPFGLGWGLSLPSVTRKTDKGLPVYDDVRESDVFLLSGSEDLVPVLDTADSARTLVEETMLAGVRYRVHLYRPRVEGQFARIERWSEDGNPGNTFWRTISRDNITTWYGHEPESRVFDPEDPRRIFQWLLCQINDDKGNVSLYQYVRENGINVDSASVAEVNRLQAVRETNRYLKRILYGNTEPYLPKLAPDAPADVLPANWMFEAVLDYGDHPQESPSPQASLPWQVRADAYSSYRAGFEVRAYRLCRRVLMFHHFEAELGVSDYLVRSTDFAYDEPSRLDNPEGAGFTKLRAVSHRSYQRINGVYDWRDLPPVSFDYTLPEVDHTLHRIDPGQLEHLPVGTQGPGYRWLDLDGEGLSGVLAEQPGGWYYKPNLGDGKFGSSRLVSPLPAMAQAAQGWHQFLDLSGNGEVDVVDFAGTTPGFHERDRDEGWKHHVPFASLPNIDWQDPNLRFVDLTGDGHADALITEQDIFTWYPSLDERGFGEARRRCSISDEDAGPRLVFADGTQTIFLADMCGDGLTDLVRIRNGEVCYWPNLGYGRFGRKVRLANSPVFDRPDHFNPQRIRLADVDGSGPVDIIYLGSDSARLYFNRSGNSLSNALPVAMPPATHNLDAVQVADLLGNGTACLVWNSHLPGDATAPVRYIDLMGGQKPHLLIRIENHLGATTTIEYTPSTRYYLRDKLAGTPWATRLPFPVHCVSKVTVEDRWRQMRFSSTYSYHHGYFDGVEREFRGFGRVEQIDTERFDDPSLDQPPVKIVTWYHTGAALDRQRILTQFSGEYFPNGYAVAGDFQERTLPEPELPAGIPADEWLEALRACKGMVLRQETYELSPAALVVTAHGHSPVRIYTAATHNCRIRCLQRRQSNRHAVFLVTESEALTYHYELALPARGSSGSISPDPRIAHTLNLRHDEYGNQQQSVAVGYGRWQTALLTDVPQPALIAAIQAEEHVAYTEVRYTGDVKVPALTPSLAQPGPAVRHRRLRLPCETLIHELKGIRKAAGARYYRPEDFASLNLSEHYGPIDMAATGVTVERKHYHEPADGRREQMRLIEHARTLYFDDGDDPAGAPWRVENLLPFGSHGPRGLKYEDYMLALTGSLLAAVFGRAGATDLRADKLNWELSPGVAARSVLADPAKSGYVSGSSIDPALRDQYWIRSGIAGFADDAHAHFYLPERFTDAFGNVTTLRYDRKDLFVESSTDAKNNIVALARDVAGKPRFDYRLLAPLEMIDVNGNHAEVAYDIRGLVVASANKGKQANGTWQGDHLGGLGPELINPPLADVVGFCTGAGFGPVQQQEARTWLGSATSRFVYHFGESIDPAGRPVWQQHPPGACAIVREIHAGQSGGTTSPLQIGLECSDGMGNVLMKKQQAEPAPGSDTLRWIVNGLTVLNNKGKPVRQYEPAFSSQGFGCEQPSTNGVSSTLYYDALGRVVRTEMPDGSFGRVEFSPWFRRSFDANDTVLEPGNRWYAEHTTVSASAEDKRAARLAAQHADTPSETHFDSLGREVIAIAHNRTPDASGAWRPEKYLTFTKLDAEGKPLWIVDARGHKVMQYVTPPGPNRTALHDAVAPNWRSAYDMPADGVPCYDIAGNILYQHSMDAGDRWMLMDAAGKPMLAWDVNETPEGASSTRAERLYSTDYDSLHRPTGLWLSTNADACVKVEHYEYQDAVANDANNLNGQLIRHYDPSGLVETVRRDFKGNVQEVHRSLVQDAGASVVDWQGNLGAPIANETFVHLTEYDALSRMTRLENWHPLGRAAAVYLPVYNERGALKRETFSLRGVVTAAIEEIRYNAKGQKEYLKLGNGTLTQYDYDEKTFRLQQLRTTRPTDASGFPQRRSNLQDAGVVQQLLYTYDSSGNITEIEDQAYKPVFFANAIAEPKSQYEYDALYRLISATGRENNNVPATEAPRQFHREEGATFPIPDSNALRRYTQRYSYDSVGNILQMKHELPGTPGGWTRDYAYAFDDPEQPASNRLWQTWTAGDRTRATTYGYDLHGSMLNLARTDPRFNLQWDHRDMIREIDLGGGGTAHYQYDSGKQRTRKRIVNLNHTGYWERIYLGGYERYRRYEGAALKEEIETHHLFEGELRVLMVDDVISTDRKHATTNVPYRTGLIYRYQYGNHLGSACLELDHAAAIISYEEYHPYGTSAYRAKLTDGEAPAKRYRYTGMERDEESGLSYHTARYYLPWVGRWCASDPSGVSGGMNLYGYCIGSPVRLVDVNGKRPATPDEMAHIEQLRDTETQAEISFAKLSTLAQVGNYFFGIGGSYAREASLAKAERKSLSETIVRAREGEGVVPYVNDIGQTQYLTDTEFRKALAAERVFQTLSNVSGGPGGAIGYLVGGDKGSDIGAIVDQVADAPALKGVMRGSKPKGESRTPSRKSKSGSEPGSASRFRKLSSSKSGAEKAARQAKPEEKGSNSKSTTQNNKRTPPDKAYWNQQEQLSAKYLEKKNNSKVEREIEIWVKKNPSGEWELVDGIRFDALETMRNGELILHEWSTMNSYLADGGTKDEQFDTRTQFFLTAARKGWAIGGRPQGACNSITDVSNATQIYQLYPHWERPGNFYRVDMPH